jgi:CYTH domain-containing protein
MALETERKFLVKGHEWQSLGKAIPYAQGYLSTERGRTVRVRIAGTKSYLTVKGPVRGITREEFEYEIPIEDAKIMMTLCTGNRIEKTRTKIRIGRHVWEVDEFSGANTGLVLAEVELSDPREHVEPPEWIGPEVTGDPRYYNSNLARHPYSEWETSPRQGN